MSTKTATRRASSAQVTFATKRTAKFIAACVTVTALAGFALSFYGLSAGVGQWMGLPTAMAYLVPLALDFGAIAFTLVAYVRAADGLPTTRQWQAVGLATAVSMASNVAHVLLTGEPTATRYAGAAFAGFAPLWGALATHQLMDLIAPAPTPKAPPSPARTPALSSSPALTVSAVQTSALTAAPVEVPAPRTAPAQDAPKRSRPYTAEDRQEAEGLARAGHSRSQIAEDMGIGRSTIVAWTAGITAEPQEAVAV